MSNVKKLLKYKEDLDEMKAEKERAQGSLDNLNERLKKEFDCDTIEEAEAKLAKVTKEAQESEDTLDKMINEFEETYQLILTK